MSVTPHAVTGPGRWPDQGFLTERVCTKCKVLKPRAEFYPDSHTRTGIGCKCKDCAGIAARTAYYKRREKVLAQKAELRKDPEWRRQQRVKDKVYRHRNPLKVNARQKMVRAVNDGRLTRMPCERCGDPRSQGHHHDYTKPLDVIWLCYGCHGEEHRRSDEGRAAIGGSNG